MIGVVNSSQNNMSAQFIVKSDDVHGGDESDLTPEQRAESRKNNSREAFERLAKAGMFPPPKLDSDFLTK